MSFSLLGRIKLKDDGATKTLAKVTKQMEQVKKATSGLTSSTDRYRSAQAGLESQGKRTHSMLRGIGSAARYAGGSFNSARSQSAGLMRSIIGLGAAYVSLRGATSLISASIGGAADLEMTSIQLEALMGNATKAKKLFDSMNKMGMRSVFSEADFLGGAKTFLPMTKDLKQLDYLATLQERLAASNSDTAKGGGMEAAAYAMREMMAGDIVSVSDRFNISKKDLYAAGFSSKAKDVMKNVKALDKVLTKYGYTQKYLTKVNGTANAQWDNFKSNLAMGLKRSGKEALDALKPFLTELNTFLQSDRASRMFARWGTALASAARAAADFGRWLIQKGGAAFDYLDKRFFSNEKFKRLPFADKISSVFAEVKTKFDIWFASGGKTMMENGAKQLVDFLAGALKASQPLIDAAVTMGKSIGAGLLTGLNDFAKANPAMAAIMTFLATPGPLQVKAGAAAVVAGGAVVEKYQIPAGANPDTLPKWQRPFVQPPHKDTSKMPWYEKALPSNWGWMPGNIPSHASGLDFVPYDNYTARLHQGESVLTKDEAKSYRDGQSGKGSGVKPFEIHMHGTIIRQQEDIDKLALRLVHYIAH